MKTRVACLLAGAAVIGLVASGCSQVSSGSSAPPSGAIAQGTIKIGYVVKRGTD